MSGRRSPARKTTRPPRRAQPARMSTWLLITVAVILWIKYQEVHG